MVTNSRTTLPKNSQRNDGVACDAEPFTRAYSSRHRCRPSFPITLRPTTTRAGAAVSGRAIGVEIGPCQAIVRRGPDIGRARSRMPQACVLLVGKAQSLAQPVG